MSPVADSPVIAPDRELDEEKKPGKSEPPRIRCPLCDWSPRKEACWFCAETNGTPSIREECAPPVFTSGLKLSAFLAADGRRIRTGMCRDNVETRAVAESDYETAVVPEDRRKYLAHYEPKSAHYEVVSTHQLDVR